MKEIFITIIIATYNAEKTLEQALYSIIEQTYKKIDLIIIDGGSKDGTLNIIEKYKKRISYLESRPDDGIYDAMNKGIKVARGDYIYFLGSDDSLCNEKVIEKVVQKIDLSEDILSGKVLVVDETFKFEYMANNKYSYQDIIKGQMLPHQGLFVKREIMQEKLFDIRYKIAGDFDFLLHCILKNRKIKYLDFPIAFYSDSGISSKKHDLLTKEYVDVMEKYNTYQKYIDGFLEKREKEKHLFFIKRTLQKVCLYKLILRKRWKVHKCNNVYCRWCKKVKEGF